MKKLALLALGVVSFAAQAVAVPVVAQPVVNVAKQVHERLLRKECSNYVIVAALALYVAASQSETVRKFIGRIPFGKQVLRYVPVAQKEKKS